MKTKAELEKDIAKLEAALENPHVSEVGKSAMRMALPKARKMLADLEKNGGGKPSTAKKKSVEKSEKKHNKALADCEELLARAKREASTREKREEKREKAGLPPHLTVGESVKKEAKTIKAKVEKIDESGKKPTAKDKVMTREGVIGIIKAFVGSLTKAQAKDFLNELVKQLKDVLKSDVSVKAENGMLIVDSTGKLSAAKNNTSFNVMKNGQKVGEIKLHTGGRSKKELTESAKKDFKKYWLKHYAHGDKSGYQLVYNGETFAEGGEVEPDSIDVNGEEGENIDVFGYQTQHFDICPEATELFQSLTGRFSNNPLAKFKDDGIREAAVLLDQLFEIENRNVSTGMSDHEDCERAIELSMSAQALITDSGAPEILTFVYPAVKNIFKVYFANEVEPEPEPMETTEPDESGEPEPTEPGTEPEPIEEPIEADEGPEMARGGNVSNEEPFDEYFQKTIKALVSIKRSHGAPFTNAYEMATKMAGAEKEHVRKYYDTGRTPRSAAFKVEFEYKKSHQAAKGKHIGFDKLAAEVTKEYKKKGYSAKRAKAIGQGTAAKVYHEQLAKKSKYPVKKKKGGDLDFLDMPEEFIDLRSAKAHKLAEKVFRANAKKYGAEPDDFSAEGPISSIEAPKFARDLKKAFKADKLVKGKDYVIEKEDEF